MTWITIEYAPGFYGGNQAWRAKIERDGTFARFANTLPLLPTNEGFAERCQGKIRATTIREIKTIVDTLDFASIMRAIRRFNIDDAPAISSP